VPPVPAGGLFVVPVLPVPPAGLPAGGFALDEDWLG
jgi:hypothetical protein